VVWVWKQLALKADELKVGRKADHVFFDGSFEASQDRKCNDQGGYTERYANDGDERDKRDEAPMPAGAEISERYEKRDWH
jgi:hypothetical protein